jgi:hypothetical protein
VYPYFQQTWTLFTPPPNSNYQLIASYEHKGQHTEDILFEILNKHQANRLLGYEPLVLTFVTGIHYFEKRAFFNEQPCGQIKNNQNFDIVEYAARNYLFHKHGQDVKNLKLTLVVKDLNVAQTRLYYN